MEAPLPRNGEGKLGLSEKDSRRMFEMRRRIALLLLISSSAMPLVGCVIPAYSANPTRRAEQLIYTSENLRQLVQEWERFWFLDQPDHMTPWRVHGGVI
jgi:hypothetical protein